MSYARRVAYNTIVQIIGRVLTTVTSLATVNVLNAALNPSGWGGYVAITTYLGFFSVLADMGLNLLYLRELSRTPEKISDITGRFLGFRLVTAAIVLSLAPIVAAAVPVYRPFLLPILILTVGQYLLTINQMTVTIVESRLQMDRAMVSDLIGRLVILLSTIFVVAHVQDSQRLLAAVSVVAIGYLINVFANLFFIRSMVNFRPRFVVREWPGIFIQVMPMAALAVLSMIHFKIDSVILTFFKPAVDVGIYGNAYKVLEIVITFPGMFLGGLFPEMNQLFLQAKGGLAVLMQKVFDLLVFAAVPLVTGLVLIAPQIIAILTRNYIHESTGALQILSFAMAPLFIGTLMANALLAAEKQKALSVVELVAVIANIALNLYLIPRYTYYGASAATVATETLSTIITTWLAIQVIGFVPKLRTLGASVLGAVVMFAVYEAFRRSNDTLWSTSYYNFPHAYQVGILIGVILIGIAAYLAPFFAFRCFPPVIQDRLNASRQKS